MSDILLPGDYRKPCCKLEENLETLEKTADHQIQRCKKCGCRHFEFYAEPGVIGLKENQ
jgi:hypothetical protein